MPALEFCLASSDLPRLLRESGVGRRSGRGGSIEWIWHDTAEGELAADQVSLCQTKTMWRLEQMCPRTGQIWSPATPAPLLREAADPAAFAPLTSPLMPIAGFRGERRVIQLTPDEPATLTILNGALRGVAQERPVCRVIAEGPAAVLQALSTKWAQTVAINVPMASLAAEAVALARGVPPLARRSGGPQVPAGMILSDAIALVIGHLTDAALAEVAGAAAGVSAEPVHAMRVAIRRLRSALSIFRRVADAPEVTAIKDPLRALAQTLGAARDWDVFLEGTGHQIAAAMPGETRITALLAAAAKRRDAAYAALRKEFASAEFRQLVVGLVQLAALRPWMQIADEDRAAKLEDDAAAFAANTLTRRHDHMLSAGADIRELPIEALHEIRKEGKRLRYTAEFFAPLYGERKTKRFLRRVSDLQEVLGHLNDGGAVAGLMQALRGGPDRQFATGAVQGFAAAHAADARDDIAESWKRLRLARPFW
ncbi:CHAD domain-containing protein [Acidisphaera sp. L21]|uniref:CHAD domain-containing protein n=1 Tax=Acidisphaera sp. L21 TaxID=1641851 RepID=UPI00131B84D3|nr:CHAD domain-containing protein [Acidisphaera sp. L21]